MSPPEPERGTGVDEQTDVVRLLICDDHRILTDTLQSVIDEDAQIQMVAPPVQTPDEAIRLVREQRPDVVLMDIEFRGSMSGIEATRRVKEVWPSAKVVIMTAHEDERLLVEAIEAGASGFLHKTEGVDELLAALKAAAAGEILVDPQALARMLPLMAKEREVRREAANRLSTLSEREREVLDLLTTGLRNDAIATRLGISPQTVQTHVRNILGKLSVHSKLEAVAFAVRHGARA
jgi:DNA-binding NarL/FixJ family response regulator